MAIVIDNVSEIAAKSMQKGKTTKITASSMDAACLWQVSSGILGALD
ncbi:hypothetical protein RFM68_16675 [Mesorhizobium sp. MSK_1335]|uniref:Uncharacterized protein n=1 Tax=Mesorhizobium montanum TaxID=3072323 RepID=A0ABU4ZQ33_9HYPH|nr:hypothetical protein [Mesorhizobium sp. MSK_1335]MDX8526138.1 hypothetical protein [Mesorhizobium sp. MSK_1335]